MSSAGLWNEAAGVYVASVREPGGTPESVPFQDNVDGRDRALQMGSKYRQVRRAEEQLRRQCFRYAAVAAFAFTRVAHDRTPASCWKPAWVDLPEEVM